ncbi:MAG: B12-binding domain-containing protein [Candidatus Thorarchaeota archaeon]
MNDNKILDKLRNAIINANSEEASILIKEALDTGINTKRIISAAIMEGAEEVGLKYEEGDYFLADMLLAADVINDCMSSIKARFKDKSQETLVKILIGTPEGDLHSIGKSLVIALLKGQGFDVIDLGVDVPPERFLEIAKKENPDIIGISGLLTMTISKMAETIALLKREGIKAKIILGGGILSEETCKQIGADAWTKDGWEGVKLIRKLVEVK